MMRPGARARAGALLDAAQAALPAADLVTLLVAVRWLAGAPHRLMHGESARLFTGLSDQARALLALLTATLATGDEDPAQLCQWLEGYLDEVAAPARGGALAAAA
jgi:hypothetical protein